MQVKLSYLIGNFIIFLLFLPYSIYRWFEARVRANPGCVRRFVCETYREGPSARLFQTELFHENWQFHLLLRKITTSVKTFFSHFISGGLDACGETNCSDPEFATNCKFPQFDDLASFHTELYRASNSIHSHQSMTLSHFPFAVLLETLLRADIDILQFLNPCTWLQKCWEGNEQFRLNALPCCAVLCGMRRDRWIEELRFATNSGLRQSVSPHTLSRRLLTISPYRLLRC